MANFFFLSFDGCISIKEAKISVKFDNFDHGKARISVRLIFASSSNSDLKLYLLIKNDENPVTLERIDSEYNECLDTEEFRQVAGAYDLRPIKELPHCTVFDIGAFPKNQDPKYATAIHPKKIACTSISYKDFPEQLRAVTSSGDILLGISVDNVTEMLSETSDIRKRAYVYMYQFRIYFGDFIPKKTLEYWKSSNKSWSIDFDLHKERRHEYLVRGLDLMKASVYPSYVELWFTIPHLHFFVASSPVYKKAFRLKPEDMKYKTKKHENSSRKQELEEFETQEGDYAVKIENRTSNFVEFSIICVSPFHESEEPKVLRENIEKLMAKNFVTWDSMISLLIFLITVLALIIAITR